MAEGGDNKRIYLRETVRTRAKLMVNGKWHDCTITNISPVGARLYLRMDVHTGKEVRIEIGDFGQYDAIVVWSYGDETGLKFAHEPSQMNDLVMALAS